MPETLKDRPRNPAPTVDIIIELNSHPGSVVLIKRRFPPLGWALPGGFVDYGESVERAACREAREETGLEVTLTALLGVYSDPRRDQRQHTISTVFCAQAHGQPQGADDAVQAEIFSLEDMPRLCFDHELIMEHYRSWRRGERTAIRYGSL